MKFLTKLNQSLGESIRDSVLRDVAKGQFSVTNNVSTAARVVATLIVGTPYLIGALGLAALIFGYPDVLMLGLGIILLALAAFLLPGRVRNDMPTLRKGDAPQSLDLLNQIARQLGAPEIHGLQIVDEINAYAIEFKPEDRVIGFGAPFWLALDDQERIAILAHEVAHLANNDPARGRLTGAAMFTLSRWYELFSPPSLIDNETNVEIVIDDRGVLGQLVGGLFGGIIEAIALSYEKLIFAQSQRAEYLADIMASSVAGAPAMQSSLKKIILAPLAEDQVGRVYYDGSKHVPVFAQMAETLRRPEKSAADVLYEETQTSLHTVDSSHPPTKYRIEVVETADQDKPGLRASEIDWGAIDAELSDAISKQEKGLLSQILVQ